MSIAPQGERPRRTVILILTASARSSPTLQLDEERRAIDLAITGASHRDHVVVHTADAIRLTDLQTALLRHRPSLIHFSGHGSGGILVNDNVGNAQLVPPAALTELFGIFTDTIRCVVLNACVTGGQAAAIGHHVPCVIGMAREISDSVAIAFAAGFYEGVASGMSVRTAFDLGRNRIALLGKSQADVPLLIARPGVAERTVIVQSAFPREER